MKIWHIHFLNIFKLFHYTSKIGCWGIYLALSRKSSRRLENNAYWVASWLLPLTAHLDDTINEDETRGAYSNMREKRNVCTILVGKPEEMRPLERGLDGKIKLKETQTTKMGGRGLNSSGWGPDYIADCCEHANKPRVCINRGDLNSIGTNIISRKTLLCVVSTHTSITII